MTTEATKLLVFDWFLLPRNSEDMRPVKKSNNCRNKKQRNKISIFSPATSLFLFSWADLREMSSVASVSSFLCSPREWLLIRVALGDVRFRLQVDLRLLMVKLWKQRTSFLTRGSCYRLVEPQTNKKLEARIETLALWVRINKYALICRWVDK